MDTINTAICIIHYKHIKLTLDCLQSLRKQTFNNFSIYLLLQNPSKEDRITIENLYGNSKKINIFVTETNVGFAEGNNILIRNALKQPQIKQVITLNNDTQVENKFVENIIAPINKKQSDMIQARMVKSDNHNKIDCLGIAFHRSGLAFNIKSYKNKLLCCPSAGAAAYSRRLLETIKLAKQDIQGFESKIEYDYFDSDYFAYNEDLDLGLRALRSGFQAYLADSAVCFHIGSASTSTMSELAVYYTYRNNIWTIYKNFSKLSLLRMSPYIIIGHLLLMVSLIKRKRLNIFIKALIDGFMHSKKHFTKKQYITDKFTQVKNLENHINHQIFDQDYLKTVR